MDDVSCQGNETVLTDCLFAGWGQHNCDHTEDAGVVCGGMCDNTYSSILNSIDYTQAHKL